MKITKKIILSIVLVLSIGAGTMANGNLPTITNVNVNNGDVLVKDIINNLQSNIKKIYDYLKGNIFIDGKLGIGTNNPSATLDVNGSANIKSDLKVNGRIETNELSIRYNNNRYGMRVYSNGDICIGKCW